jgi:hypothetical protein
MNMNAKAQHTPGPNNLRISASNNGWVVCRMVHYSDRPQCVQAVDCIVTDGQEIVAYIPYGSPWLFRLLAFVHNTDIAMNCLYAGGKAGAERSGGDCEHALGLNRPGPDGEAIPRSTDIYGKPEGWCWWCWKQYQLRQAETALQIAQAWIGDNLGHINAASDLLAACELAESNITTAAMNFIEGNKDDAVTMLGTLRHQLKAAIAKATA